MRVKTLPAPPDDLSAVEAAHRAVPLVPGSEDDCCARLMDRLDLQSRDRAATWLSFLRGVGLAEEGKRGFSRVRRTVDRESLAGEFLSGVFGAREVADALEAADEPLTPGDAFERVEHRVPGWERRKHGTAWREVWRGRVGDLLEWLVLLGLAEERDGRYAGR